jgi:hypothetical protein
MDRELHIC